MNRRSNVQLSRAISSQRGSCNTETLGGIQPQPISARLLKGKWKGGWGVGVYGGGMRPVWAPTTSRQTSPTTTSATSVSGDERGRGPSLSLYLPGRDNNVDETVSRPSHPPTTTNRLGTARWCCEKSSWGRPQGTCTATDSAGGRDSAHRNATSSELSA